MQQMISSSSSEKMMNGDGEVVVEAAEAAAGHQNNEATPSTSTTSISSVNRGNMMEATTKTTGDDITHSTRSNNNNSGRTGSSDHDHHYHNNNDDDCKEQVMALLQAIKLLSEIAAATTTTTTTSAVDNNNDSSSSATPSGPSGSASGTTSVVSDARCALIELQSTWMLEDTYIPQLLEGIDRLQSTSTLLQTDADNSTLQIQVLQKELSQSQSRIRKLENALQRMYNKHTRLQHQIQDEKRILAQQVKNYVVKKNEDEQRHYLAAHERLLKLEQAAGSRSRCSSRDDDNYMLSDNDEDADVEDTLSLSSSVLSSSRSYVTDDGVATIRYTSKATGSVAASCNNVDKNGDDDKNDDDEERTKMSAAHEHEQEYDVYDLTFPQGTKIGLQFHKIQLVNDEETPFPKREGLLNDAIIHQHQQQQGQSSTAAPLSESALSSTDVLLTTQSSSPFATAMNFNFDSFRSASNKQTTTTTTTATHEHEQQQRRANGSSSHHFAHVAYIVCGHYGFDRDVNTQPSLGARLVKVNGDSVEDMTLDKIKAAIKCTQRDFFSLSFCNVPLNSNQREELDAAIHAARQQYEQDDDEAEEEGGAAATRSFLESSSKVKKPVIICLHTEGGGSTNRLSSFLSVARSRTFSDNAVVRVESTGSSGGQDADSSTKDRGGPSPSVRSLYSLIQGEGRVKLDSDDVVNADHFGLVRCEQEPSSSSSSHDGRSRLSSMFSTARSRTFSDGAVPVEPSTRSSVVRGGAESSNGAALTSPSTTARGFYSMLHGNESSFITDANSDIPLDTVDGDGRDPSLEAFFAMEAHGKRLASVLHSARIRSLSDNSVPVDLSERDEVASPPGHTAARETPGGRLTSFFHGPRDKVESSGPVGEDALSSTRPGSRPPTAETLSEVVETTHPNGTPPSQKLKKSMNHVGSKFKSLFE